MCCSDLTEDDLVLLSHPNKLLIDHLRNVAGLARRVVEQYYPSGSDDFDKMVDAAYVVGLTHDIGKCTSYFQQRIRGLKPKTALGQHSKLSAVVTYYLFKNQFAEDDTAVIWLLYAYTSVLKHHGDLDDVANMLLFEKNDQSLLMHQVDSICEESLRALSLKMNLPLTKDSMKKWVSAFYEEANIFRAKVKRYLRNSDITSYIRLAFLYSALLEADKNEVVLGGIEPRTTLQVTERPPSRA